MGTPSPAYSQALEADLEMNGGHYIEARVPVLRKSAEKGQLVGMPARDNAVAVSVQLEHAGDGV
jgi:3-hydroxyisobutyrate dehydrogenase